MTSAFAAVRDEVYSLFKIQGFRRLRARPRRPDGRPVEPDARLGFQRRLLVDASAKTRLTTRSTRFRQAILQALLDQEVLSEQAVEQMLADNGGEFKGSLLEELINQLIERLVEEGYLNLKEVPSEQRREIRDRHGQGEIGSRCRGTSSLRLPRRASIFSVTKTLQKLLGSLGKSSIGRHETHHLDTGVEAALSSKQYEFGDTINLDVNATAFGDHTRRLIGADQSRIPRSACPPTGLQFVVRNGRHARLLAFDDPLR